MDLKYYNPEIHRASFILPEFAKKVLLVFVVHVLRIFSAFSLTCFVSFLFIIDRYSVRRDQQKPFDWVPPPSPLTSEKCSSLYYFITVDGFPIKLFLDGGAANGRWWLLAGSDWKSVISTFVGFTCHRFYFWDVLSLL